MKKLIYTAICASLIFGLSSCQNDESSANEGAITIAANIDDSPMVRSGETDDELKNNAKVNIYLPSYGGLIRQYTYSQKPDIIYLPEGEGYRVDVEAGERVAENPKIASFDSKSYKGSASFNVTAGVVNTTPIVVEAKICNAITNVTFGEGVEEAFNDGYQLSIGLDSNNLVYTASNAGTDGYFIIADDAEEPKLDWIFTGTLAKGGTSFTKSGSFAVEQGKKYLMNVVYTEHNGVLKVIIRLDTSTNDKDDTIIFEPTSVGLGITKPYEIWAKHATVRADVDPALYDASKIYFEYKTTSGTEWTRTTTSATPASNKSDETSYYTTLLGLQPNTTYEYRLIAFNKEKQEEEIVPGTRTLTTGAATAVENGGFEQTCMENKLPAFFPEGGTKWWCCGNQATKDYVGIIGQGGVITTSSADVPAGLTGSTKSVLMESKYLEILGGSVKKFAAGNIFYGRYFETVGTEGGSVYFGRPFTARPVGLRCWVKYQSGKVTHVGSSSPITKDEYDIAQIKVALGIWDYKTYGGDSDSPVNINTTITSTFIDYAEDKYDPKEPDKSGRTLAYGDLQITSADTGADYVENINGTTKKRDYTKWQEVVIPLVYYDKTTMPTHLIISVAGSKYGDYLSGCNGGKMWLDGVELIYDLNELE